MRQWKYRLWREWKFHLNSKRNLLIYASERFDSLEQTNRLHVIYANRSLIII